MDTNRYDNRLAADEGLTAQIREARRIAQPAASNANPPDRVYRAVSIYPSMILARLGITANQITIGWIILGIVGVIALASPSYAVRVSGAIALEVSYLFDFVDGEVARLTDRCSKLGYLLDLAGHAVIKTVLFLAIGYGYAAYTHHYQILILAFLACLGISVGDMVPFLVAEAFPQTKAEPPPAGQPVQAARSGVRKLIAWSGYLFESTGIYPLVLLGAASNQLGWILWFYGVLAPLWFLYRLARFRP
ncbi:MAG: CDP-alcohol phosphatidyltransferase family protein [Acidobacteriota bacterium]|nr:CDP-alcohol phosphatidyltransferase family protein [Acidobacteriota bacterium]